MELSERKKKILTAVIDDYIATAEPVGSKKIAQNSGLGLSSATIRNEMADLTSLGYLEQPHTSAGRIPSPLGYRIYVNELMQRHKLSLQEADTINRTLSQRLSQLDRLISEVGNLASSFTSYTAYSLAAPSKITISRFDLIHVDQNTFIIVVMLSNSTVKNKLIHLPVSVSAEMVQKLSTVFNAHFTGITEDKITPLTISSMEKASGDTQGLVSAIAGFAIELLMGASSGEAYVTGVPQLLRQPEFRDPDKAHKLISYLSDSETLLQLPAPADDGEIKMLIGPENVAEELRDSSVIMAKYSMGEGVQGLVGIVGPTRMDYAKVAAKLQHLAGGLNKLLSDDERPALDLGETIEQSQIGDVYDEGQ